MRDPVPSDPDLRAAIADARDEVGGASRQLTDRANDVFRVTTTVAGEAVERLVEGFVLGQPDQTQRLGRSGIGRLRSELQAALGKLPGESAKRLVSAFAWTFPEEAAWIGDGDRVPLFQGGHDTPWMIDDTLRVAAGTAGSLGATAGYEISPRSYWDVDHHGEVRRYLGPLPTPSALVIALRSYSDARLRYFRKLRALRRLEAEKAARDARIESEVAQEAAVLPAITLWAGSAKAS